MCMTLIKARVDRPLVKTLLVVTKASFSGTVWQLNISVDPDEQRNDNFRSSIGWIEDRSYLEVLPVAT